jgi:hypothetical protein
MYSVLLIALFSGLFELAMATFIFLVSRAVAAEERAEQERERGELRARTEAEAA